MQRRLKDINFLDVVLWIFRAVIIGGVIWGSIATIIENPYPMHTWIETIIAGVAQGSLYALIAIGYTLVYGVLFMINFAHGEFFMALTDRTMISINLWSFLRSILGSSNGEKCSIRQSVTSVCLSNFSLYSPILAGFLYKF